MKQFGVALMGIGLLWSAALQAQPQAEPRMADAQPQAFAFFDQNPTAQIYGLPRAGGYSVLAQRRQRWTFYLSQSSNFLKQHNDRESLLFDGAITRAALVYTRGLGDGWQLRATLPFVAHSGGFADSWIVDFHRTFGFDAGERNSVADDQQQYYYSRDGRMRLAVDDSPSGIGDLRLAVKKSLGGFGDWGMSAAAQLKLPTGDADALTGSGGADLALWTVIGNNREAASRWRFLTGLGVLYTRDGEVLPDMRRNWAAFGWLVLGYALAPRFVVRAQLYVHSPFFDDTGMEALDGVAVQGAFGFEWRVSEGSALSIAFIEDFNSGVTPDVALLMGLDYQF